MRGKSGLPMNIGTYGVYASLQGPPCMHGIKHRRA